MKQRTHGQRYEFTKRGYFEAESFDEGLDLIQGAAEGQGDGLAALERLCRNVLAEHGLPSDDRRFAAKPDHTASCGFLWRQYEDATQAQEDEPRTGKWRALRGVRYLTQGHDPLVAIDSGVGYASRILDCILRAREAQSAGDLDGALDWAAGAGALANESDIADWYANEKAKGAAVANSPKEQARQRYLKDAKEIIARDTNQDLRIGELVERLQAILKACGLPVPSDRSIRSNLHGEGVIPTYMSQGGRRSS